MQTSTIVHVETDVWYLEEEPLEDREDNQSSGYGGVPCPAGIVLEKVDVHNKETLFLVRHSDYLFRRSTR